MNHEFRVAEAVPLRTVPPEQRKASLKSMEEAFPELWAKCYPKIYQGYKPNEYPSPKVISYAMLNVALKVEQGFQGQSEIYEIEWASQLAQYRVPMYWVTRDLAEAVMQTTPPMTLDWYDFPLAFPAMAFLLPKGFLTHETEGNVEFVSFARHKALADIPSLASAGPRHWHSINGGMVTVAHTEASYLTHWNMPYDAFPVADLKKLDELVERYDDNQHSTGWLESPQMTKADTRLGAKVAHFIFGLWLLMNRKPELLTPTQQLKRLPPKKGEKAKEFWSPNVLGMNYRIRRESVSLGGTHASPVGHWVKGHWREQRHGPQNSLTKDIWLEPFWKGGEAL